MESEILWCAVVRTVYWSTTQQDPNNRMFHCPKSHLSFSMDPKSLVVWHLKREVVILSVQWILFLGTRARSSRPPSGLHGLDCFGLVQNSWRQAFAVEYVQNPVQDGTPSLGLRGTRMDHLGGWRQQRGPRVIRNEWEVHKRRLNGGPQRAGCLASIGPSLSLCSVSA